MQVFILQDRHAGGEVQPAEHEWVEDLQWAARLSQGWHLPSVREVGVRPASFHPMPHTRTCLQVQLRRMCKLVQSAELSR